MTRAPASAVSILTMRSIAGVLALGYALLVVAMNLGRVSGFGGLAYVLVVVAAPIGVLVGQSLAQRGDKKGDPVAQIGLGLIFGVWALPATSGLVALVAIVAGIRAAMKSSRPRIGISSLAVGVLAGVLVLGVSFTRS